MHLLETASEAARAGGTILAASRNGRAMVISQIGRDIKLREDAACEAAIRGVLASTSDYPVLGEENGWGDRAATDDLHWVIDPLDGSFNYYRGIPLYAVSVALCRGPVDAPEVLLGAIYDPERDELISGGPQHPLSLNGVPVSPRKEFRQILATGYPTRSDPAEVTARLGAATGDWKKIRMLGSAALSLAWVAIGRLDAYSEQSIMWWDVAAGIALARAAGLARVDLSPRAAYSFDVTVIA